MGDEYVWKAAWSFHTEGDPAAEEWVRRHAAKILAGKATLVAGSIRRHATKTGLTPTPTHRRRHLRDLPDQQSPPTWTTPPRSNAGYCDGLRWRHRSLREHRSHSGV